MHIENELVESVTVGEQEYEEVIEEYEEEVPKPSLTDLADTPPAKGKPRYITLILNDHWIYMMYIYVTGIFMETTCINISTYESY